METITKEAVMPISTAKTNSGSESFAMKFKKIYLGDDLDGFMQLLDIDIVWTFMATGEKFSGIEQVRKAAEKSMAGRIHTKDLHMELTNLFWSENHVCIEYLHRGLAPQQGTIAGSPKAGTEIAVPICITMHLKDGKIDMFNEYLNLATFSGLKEQLFS